MIQEVSVWGTSDDGVVREGSIAGWVKKLFAGVWSFPLCIFVAIWAARLFFRHSVWFAL